MDESLPPNTAFLQHKGPQIEAVKSRFDALHLAGEEASQSSSGSDSEEESVPAAAPSAALEAPAAAASGEEEWETAA